MLLLFSLLKLRNLNIHSYIYETCKNYFGGSSFCFCFFWYIFVVVNVYALFLPCLNRNSFYL